MHNVTTEALVESLVTMAIYNGGATIPATQSLAVPTTGYVVAYAGGIVLREGNNDIGQIVEFVQANKATALFHPNHYFGSWLNGYDIHVDLVRVFHEHAVAMEFARANHQLAIYDIKAGADIRVTISANA